jgi:hypothetical protein
MIQAVIAVVLALATLAGSFLRVLARQTMRGAGARATIDNLDMRIRSWWAIELVRLFPACRGPSARVGTNRTNRQFTELFGKNRRTHDRPAGLRILYFS